MPSLKDLKNRIGSVKSTQKITSAMKMVAASKLRRAQEAVEASRPYAERMDRMMSAMAAAFEEGDYTPKMIRGTGEDKVRLIVVITSDRGLCGGLNSGMVRTVRRDLQSLAADGKEVKLICVGRKGRDLLRREYGSLIIDAHEDVGKTQSAYEVATTISEKMARMYEDGGYDIGSVYYSKFKSVISQEVTLQQLVPVPPPAVPEEEEVIIGRTVQEEPKVEYEFEPDQEQVLAALLPRNLTVQVYRALLESGASEQGARMTAMDNATRNAGEMINNLTLTYNRTRQAYITNELIEIISGAEAL